MKNTFLIAAGFLLASCSSGLVVEVTNSTDLDREHETVELAWSELTTLKDITPENVVVMQDDEQIPSQVIYRGNTQPIALLFQAEVDAKEMEKYVVTTGVRENYRTQAYGRYVPERKDDYAWENNKVAYRLYGPGLETELVSPGIDVWVKSTDRLIVDEWFARNDYHHNYGDGMDCYKVGPTLGAGACAPFIDGKLWLSHNYATQECLDNGPIRTTVKLTYAPFDANGRQVSLTKYISLDANNHFNRMENNYDGEFDTLSVATGFVRHDVKGVRTGTDWLAMYEASSDTKDPVRDGNIYFGILLPKAQFLPDSVGHVLAVTPVIKGQLMTYYCGSGWSLAGITDFNEWIEMIHEEQAALITPLTVTVVKR
ncbi:MAG: DUF4861 family protein [Alistipes sp.]